MAVTTKKKIIIIGAGPAGSVAATLLQNKGHQVTILERNRFPRFSIGESLLPQCMEFIAQAGMLGAVEAAGFQRKTGATFIHQEKKSDFCFSDKFTPGYDSTFQVPRDRFDALLAEQAQLAGVDICWQHQVTGADFSTARPVLNVIDNSGTEYDIETEFVLDASGFGRVLPRLLGLDRPSDFPVRQSLFTHIEDRIDSMDYDRDYIRIMVNPKFKDVWYWLIPFSNGRCSLGVVGCPEVIASAGDEHDQVFREWVFQEPSLKKLLHRAVFDTPVSSLKGYSANVSTMHGHGYALLGNAGEFLDPVFSSGVTIAMKSASLAADIVDRQLKQQTVDWETEFVRPMQVGIETFRTFIKGWYEGGLQDVIFYKEQQGNIKQMICSILAGYVWDENNPYVKNPRLRLKTLTELCRQV
jgi:flavin-dependent dehydrogenase